MTKNDLVSRLNEIYGELDSFSDDYTLSEAVKNLNKIKDKLGDIVENIEDDGIEQDDTIREKE